MAQNVNIVQKIIEYIEDHLHENIDQDTLAASMHYSKYYLHRLFTKTIGLSIHTYILRRRLSEAARSLAQTQRPIMEIALWSGYESQRTFTNRFRKMYKIPPAKFRKQKQYYPLQLRMNVQDMYDDFILSKATIRHAKKSDIPSWITLLHLVVDGYPSLNEVEYRVQLEIAIEQKRALLIEDEHELIGALVFRSHPCWIDFLGIHPQYRNSQLTQLFLNAMKETYCPNQEIWISTFRKYDPADTGYREEFIKLGFMERECSIEFDYPTQHFVLPVNDKKKERNKYE
ncbi:helix-turn-helix domain-containing protein [Dubosiella newyorkensis]|uniref:helix-turn-helix domain-containing protein n=1 Tax=Dubosiella newyorkensis TaxID=1862672 RepID=UPI00248CC92D|nr:helix-turn-helix domain-containing protein [Dubosiella newyorkensis]